MVPSSLNKKAPLASIIIRAYNEERYIETLLKSLENQKTKIPFETILVDSESTDRTVEIARRYNVTIITIPKASFTFGRSLNLGFQHAHGQYCIAISAHCWPENDQWLNNIMEDFRDEKVMVVFGRQLGCDISRFSEKKVFEKWYPKDNCKNFPIPFSNNANAAYRKSCWIEHPFDETLSGLEDIGWVNRGFIAGQRISYRADAQVYHLHQESWKQVRNRYYREGLAYQEIFSLHPSLRFFDFPYLFVLNVLSDLYFAKVGKCFIKEFRSIFCYRAMQFFGYYLAYKSRTKAAKTIIQRLFYPNTPSVFVNDMRSHIRSADMRGQAFTKTEESVSSNAV